MYRLANGYEINGAYPSTKTQKIIQRIISNNTAEMILTTFGPLSEKGTFDDEERAILFLKQTIYLRSFLGKTGTLNDNEISVTAPWEQIILRRYADIYKKMVDTKNEYTFDEFGEGLLFELFEFFREPDNTKYLAFYEDNVINKRFEYPITIFGSKKEMDTKSQMLDAINHGYRYHTIYKPYSETLYMQKDSIPKDLDKALWEDAERMVCDENLEELIKSENLDELKPHPNYTHQDETYIERYKHFYVYFWEKYVCQIMNYGYHVDDDYEYPFYDEQPDYDMDEWEDEEDDIIETSPHGTLELFGLDYEVIPSGFRDIFFWDEDYKFVLSMLSESGESTQKLNQILNSGMFGMVAKSSDNYFTNNDNAIPLE